MKNALSASLPLAMVALACVGDPPELTEDQAAAQAEFTLAEAPSPQHELDIRYEGRVRLVGYDVSVEEITLGQPFDITWYWHVDRRLPPDWLLFTHVADATEANRCNADETSSNNGCEIEAPLRRRFDPSLWSEGSWVRDPEHVTIPTDWHSDAVVFYLGLYTGNHRLSVTAGPHDEDARGRAVSLPIAGTRSRVAAPAPAAAGRRG